MEYCFFVVNVMYFYPIHSVKGPVYARQGVVQIKASLALGLATMLSALLQLHAPNYRPFTIQA